VREQTSWSPPATICTWYVRIIPHAPRPPERTASKVKSPSGSAIRRPASLGPRRRQLPLMTSIRIPQWLT